MIRVKDIGVLKSIFTPVHPVLLDVLEWFDKTHPRLMVITDGYRPNDKGCHGTTPLRAIDLRSRIFTDPVAIERGVNNNWVYDPDRLEYQVCLFHRTPNGAHHFHIQVHDKTERIH